MRPNFNEDDHRPSMVMAAFGPKQTKMVNFAVKVACLGAAGGIGQPLSLLLKANPLVTELALYDIVNTPGVAADLSHINTPAAVTGYKGDAELEAAVKNAHIVVIPAG
ncbi:malate DEHYDROGENASE, NAD-dependent, partial [Kappamyces sp. JEL0680]